MATPEIATRSRTSITLQALLTRLQSHNIYAFVAAFDIILIAAILLVWLMPQRARFSVDVRTETASVAIAPGDRMPDWGAIQIFQEPREPEQIEDPELVGCKGPTVTFSQLATSKSTFTWTIESGALQLVASSEGSPLGKLNCEGSASRPAPSYLVARWPLNVGSTPTLKFAGELSIGDEPAASTQEAKLLQSGTLTAEASSWPFHSGKATSRVELALGDKLQFVSDDADKPASAFGVVRGDQGGLRLIAYADGSSVRVLRAGQEKGEPLIFAPSLIARLQAQAEWTVLLICAALFLNFLSALNHVQNARQK